jgi:aspartokinase-like uncharacterized kinase
MSGRFARVIKLGGSLLDDSGWPERFRRWLGQQPPMRNVLIVGGGALADAVRNWDRVHGLSQTVAHRLAIDTMSVTAKLAAALLPETRLSDEWQCLVQFAESDESEPAFLIFDPARFLKESEPTLDGDRLPASWDVTSDSIAARMARLLTACELVLLKSCLPREQVAATECDDARSDYFDRSFRRFSAGIPRVRFVNLRDAEFAETTFG